MPIRTINVGNDRVTGFGAPVTVKITSLSGKPLQGATVEMNLPDAIKRGKTDSYGVCTIQLPKNQDVEIWASKPDVNFGSGTGLITRIGKLYAYQRTGDTEIIVNAREYPAAAGYAATAVGVQSFDLWGWAQGALSALVNPVPGGGAAQAAVGTVQFVRNIITPEPNLRTADETFTKIDQSLKQKAQSILVNTPAPDLSTRIPSLPTPPVPTALPTPKLVSPPSTFLKGDIPAPSKIPAGISNITSIMPGGAQNPVIQNPAGFQSGLVDVIGQQPSGISASTIVEKINKGLPITDQEKTWAQLYQPDIYSAIVSGVKTPSIPVSAPIPSSQTLVAPVGKVIWNIAAAGYDPVASKQKSSRGQYTSLYDAWVHDSQGGSLDSYRKKFLAGQVDVDIVTGLNEVAWELANGSTVVKASSYAESGGRSIGDPTNFTVYQESKAGITGPVKGIGFSWSGMPSDKVVVTAGGDKQVGQAGIINQLMSSNSPEMQALRARTVDVRSLTAADADKQAVFQQMAANLIQRGSTVVDVTNPSGPLTQDDLNKLKSGIPLPSTPSSNTPVAILKGLTITQGIVDKLKSGGTQAKAAVDDLVSKGVTIPEIQNLPGITAPDIQKIPGVPTPQEALDKMKGGGNMQIKILTP